MSLEIERKFLVISDDFKKQAVKETPIKQAYLSAEENLVVRVRIQNNKAFLTIKNKSQDSGLSRQEWEMEIPVEKARELFENFVSGHIIEKKRYIVPFNDLIIEVDEFIQPRRGLKLAEIEFKDLKQARLENLNLPGWIGEEVTGKREYYNAFMAKNG